MTTFPAQWKGSGFVLPIDAVEIKNAREFVLRVVRERRRDMLCGRSGYRNASSGLRQRRPWVFLLSRLPRLGGCLLLLRPSSAARWWSSLIDNSRGLDRLGSTSFCWTAMPAAAPAASPAFRLGGAVFGFSLLRGRLNLVPASLGFGIRAPAVASSSPSPRLGRLARYVLRRPVGGNQYLGVFCARNR